MEPRLTFEYDAEGDVLYVNRCAPYAEQESDELGDEVVARFNPTTGDIENLEILFFRKRIEHGETLNLPIFAEFRPLKSA